MSSPATRGFGSPVRQGRAEPLLGALLGGAVHGADLHPGAALVSQLGHRGQLERLGGLLELPGGRQRVQRVMGGLVGLQRVPYLLGSRSSRHR